MSTDSNGLVIEKGIPIPERKKAGSMTEILNKMEIGDSIVLPRDKVRSWITNGQKNIKLCWRSISKTEARLWRIE